MSPSLCYWEEALLRFHPLGHALKEEIQAAWDHFTRLPTDHANRIHVISESPFQRRGVNYYKICYHFRDQDKEIHERAIRTRSAKEVTILKVLKETGLDINGIPIPAYFPQCLQEKIENRRRPQVPKEESGKGEGTDYDTDDDIQVIFERH